MITIINHHPPIEIWIPRVSGSSGGGSGTAASYQFTQSSAAVTWTVNHNLGYKPMVEVFSVGGVKLPFVSIIHVSDNQFQVSHNVAAAGFARYI